MSVGFDGDVVVITGAGRGIGREHAKLCAQLGARVVVNDAGVAVDGVQSENPADLVVAEIREAGGIAVASRHSIDDAKQAKEIVDLALDEFGDLHAVIHNAGILRDRTFHNLSDDDIERVMAVHLLGAFNVLRPAVTHMREQRYGRIVLTSSASGILGTFGQSNYGAAKMGLIGLMNVLAIEGASRGILVNSLAPSARTRMTEELLGPLADALDPVHVAPLVAFLASRSCSVTHEIFAAGGGRYNPSYNRLEVWDGNSWIGLATHHVDLDPQIYEILDWARARMAEDRQLEELCRKHPGLQEAYDRFQIMRKLVKAEK